MVLENSIYVGITLDPISVETLASTLDDPSHGAQLLFTGIVRNRNQGRKVVSVAYDAFAPLATTVFKEICIEAQAAWGQALKVGIIHRLGCLKIGEMSVVILVGSVHREEAYQASRYIIEELKNRAPVWKKETYEDGESEWLKGHALCSNSEKRAQL